MKGRISVAETPTADYYDRVKPVPATDDEWACQGCNGARYVRYERPVGNPLFGKYTACLRCTEVEAEVPHWAR